MKNALFALAFGLLLSSCSPTWWQDFKNNPVAQTNVILNTAMSIEDVSVVVFGQLKQFLPADKQATYQQKFDESLVALNGAMQALRDAVKAAADAQVANPDLTTEITAVVKAIQDVKDVVSEIHTLLQTPAPDQASGTAGHLMTAKPVPEPVGFDLMNKLAASVKK